MADVSLVVQPRTLMGKRAGRLRRQGIIPANIYGKGVEPSIPVQLPVRVLRDVLLNAGTTTVVDVHVQGANGQGAGDTHSVLIERIARRPATGEVLHVDLHRVDLSRPVHTAVPISIVGESPAAGQGGVLFHPLDTIEVEALPRDLPHTIEVDISAITEVDGQITVADLRLPPGVKALTDSATVVAKVAASRLEAEITAEAVEAVETAEAMAATEERGAPRPAAGEAKESAGRESA